MNKILLAGAALVMSSGMALAQDYNSSTSTTTTTQAPVVVAPPPVSTTTRTEHSVSDQNGVMTEETKRAKVTTPSVVAPSVTQTTHTEKTTTSGSDD
ncbi:MAG TPA: hypothetical protein VGV37_01345 [Aliidongia sp.]|uniref:hypothetical protein n=1 Tax=Aliidongia sp. TaxID=1914230 RepID=UPI002DDD20DC|nr:hypothetical protein [Aliidongia sp.]HEV2673153.1 hypothetical protein [Aliidongia sp.]